MAIVIRNVEGNFITVRMPENQLQVIHDILLGFDSIIVDNISPRAESQTQGSVFSIESQTTTFRSVISARIREPRTTTINEIADYLAEKLQGGYRLININGSIHITDGTSDQDDDQ